MTSIAAACVVSHGTAKFLASHDGLRGRKT